MGDKTQGGWMGVAWSGGKEGLFWGSEFRPGDPGKPTLYPYHFSVGDFPCHEIKNPKNGTNSRKTSTIFSG